MSTKNINCASRQMETDATLLDAQIQLKIPFLCKNHNLYDVDFLSWEHFYSVHEVFFTRQKSSQHSGRDIQQQLGANQKPTQRQTFIYWTFTQSGKSFFLFTNQSLANDKPWPVRWFSSNTAALWVVRLWTKAPYNFKAQIYPPWSFHRNGTLVIWHNKPELRGKRTPKPGFIRNCLWFSVASDRNLPGKQVCNVDFILPWCNVDTVLTKEKTCKCAHIIIILYSCTKKCFPDWQ